MDLIPLGERVMVEPIDDTPDATPSGIITTIATTRKKPHKGRVLAYGDGVDELSILTKGDIVFYGEFAGSSIPGSANLIMNLSDIIAKLRS